MTGETILHVDMDAFYASVEARDDPTLAGIPLAVGGAGARGVVMSASYEARAYGVRSAMPSVQARRLCSELVFVPPDFNRYQAESKAIREVFESFSPLVEMISLDEAFLDVSGAGRLFGSAEDIAHRIRERIRSDRRLNCSVGVAPNKFLAKLASANAKPDGVVVVRANGIRAFIDPLPVEDLWGVGEQTATALRRLGARTVAELRALPRGALAKALGQNAAAHLMNLAEGSDERRVTPHEPAKQVSAENTFERDLDAPEDINRELLRLADRVAVRLRKNLISARTVTIKVRFSTFKTLTRSRTLEEPTAVAEKIAQVARELFEGMRLDRPRIRLLGVAATGLISGEGGEQLRIDDRPDPWRQAEEALDRVRGRFGSSSAGRAALADRTPVRRRPRGR
jgi:DNA polymerase IV